MAITFEIDVSGSWQAVTGTDFPAARTTLAHTISATAGRTPSDSFAISVAEPSLTPPEGKTNPTYDQYIAAGCVPLIPSGMKGRKILVRAKGGAVSCVLWVSKSGAAVDPDPRPLVIPIEELLVWSSASGYQIDHAVVYGAGSVEFVAAGE